MSLMTFESVTQFHFYFYHVIAVMLLYLLLGQPSRVDVYNNNIIIYSRLMPNKHSVLNVKVVVAAFNQEQAIAIVGAL